MEGLTFQEAGHIYRYNGVVVPSVSEIIAMSRDLASIPEDVLAAASARGTDVHHATALHDQSILDVASVTTEIEPYLDAWHLFMNEHEVTWHYIEVPFYHRLLRYAGTPDRVGFVDGDYIVPDIKTTVQLHPAFGLQSAAYANLVEASEGTRPQRATIQLKKDGTYVFVKHTDEYDRVVFQSMLNCYHWGKKWLK